MDVMTTDAVDIEIDDTAIESEEYVDYKIASYPSDLTISVIDQMWKDGDIVIPRFQRSFVWTQKQSSLLIESFLLGLPVPQVFFYVDEKGKSLVIDGQQRIRSVLYFLEGYFGEENPNGRRTIFRLNGLAEQSPYNGKKYSDLTEEDQRKLRSTVLRAINIRQLSPDDDKSSMYHIFERLNTGGTPLRPQEIRNCVYAGPIIDRLHELNELPSWRSVIGRPKPEKHQRDVEFILRIFSLWLDWEAYDKPMKRFLSKHMEAHKSGNTKEFNSFAGRFARASDVILDTLGERPFHIRGPINLAAMDSVYVALLSEPRCVESFSLEKFRELIGISKFQNAIFFNTSDASEVNARIKLAVKILK